MCMWSIIIISSYISYILRKSSPHNSEGIKVVSLFSYRGKSYFEDKQDNKLIATVVVVVVVVVFFNLEMCGYRSVYRNKQVSSVSVSLRFVGRFPKRTSSYKNLFYKLNVMLSSLKAYKSVLFSFRRECQQSSKVLTL